MPLDAICLSAVKDELLGQIRGMKIDKIQQPERDVIILSLRGSGKPQYRLLLSAGSGDTRVHLTEHRFDNPNVPPMFCMLLRKHLTGARIVDIKQPPAERVLTILFESFNAMGVQSEKSLIIEMIGGRSNIIFTDSDGIILDCLRRTGEGISETRAVLPGLLYRSPTAQEGKLNPLSVSDTQLCELLKDAGDVTIDKWLISTFTAFSPLICREIAWRAYGETDYRVSGIKDGGAALRDAFLDLTGQVNSGGFEPWLILAGEKPKDFSYTRIIQYEAKYMARREAGFSQMLDEYFTRSAQEMRISQRSAATLKAMITVRDRFLRKLAAQRTEFEGTSRRDSFRECGDLITANFHLIKKGQKVLLAEDFYSENGGQREVKLDPLKSPQQNAAKYYKAYTKAKNAQKFLAEQIQSGEKELEYIESVIEQLQRAENKQDLNEIRGELSSTGYVRLPKQLRQQKQVKHHKQQKTKQSTALPHRFLSTEGVRILAGRNNMQNDRLTFKTADRFDIWLHAQKIHGAHVIISCTGKTPDDKTLQEAAAIAAYYSAARTDGKVSVDYTLVKNVKKPSGSRPGMVIYSDYKTVLVVPDEDLVMRLRDEG